MGARLARSLFERHGIPKHRHASFVGEFFGLSRAAAHRRVHSTAAWTLEELERVAVNFGETLPDLFGVSESKGGLDSILKIGSQRLACRAWVEPSTAPRTEDLFVATEQGGSYVITPAAEADSSALLRVLKLEIDQAQPTGRLIAVLDDKREVTDALCKQLNHEGFDARPYYSASALEPAIDDEVFDAYVLDWLLPKGTAEPLIAKIRMQARPRAIVILTGEARDGAKNENGIIAAIDTYKVGMCEKPARTSYILRSLYADGLSRLPASIAR